MTMYSPFRQLMDTWDAYCEAEAQISKVLDGGNMILFFQRGDDLFGAPEESRLVFSRMKNPEPEENLDGASFLATNLIQALAGQGTDCMFSHKDLPEIKILDRDAVAELLKQRKGKSKKKK